MASACSSISSNAQPLSFAACLKPSGVPHPEQVIDLTVDGDGDNDAIETAPILSHYSLRFSSSSLRKPPAHTADDLTTYTTEATPGTKLYPWKNVPHWSKLYNKLQHYSTSSKLERSPKDPRGPVSERPENSPEIPESPIIALESVRCGDDDHSDDGNTGTQTVTSASMVAGSGDPKVDSGSSFVHNRPHNEYDTGSVETDNLRSTDQTEPVASTNSGEVDLSIARSSEQTLAPMTVSASSLSDVGKNGLGIVDISKLITVEVVDKRSSSCGVEYKCSLEPMWLAADLVERVRRGRVRIRRYENGLVRDRRLKTLRVRKRNVSVEPGNPPETFATRRLAVRRRARRLSADGNIVRRRLGRT